MIYMPSCQFSDNSCRFANYPIHEMEIHILYIVDGDGVNLSLLKLL